MTSVSDSSVVENQESGIYEPPSSALELMAIQTKILADTMPDEGVKAKSRVHFRPLTFSGKRDHMPMIVTSETTSVCPRPAAMEIALASIASIKAEAAPVYGTDCLGMSPPSDIGFPFFTTNPSSSVRVMSNMM